MVDIKYTYSISDDFLNSMVSTGSLTQEIQNSSITIALSFINTLGDNCDIWFKAELSLDEITILNNIVAIHTGEEITEIENPTTDDGKIYVAPNIFPIGVITNFCGVCDDVDNGIIGGGDQLAISSYAAGDSVKYFRFIEWTYLAGGHVIFTNADFGDWCSFSVSAPATVATSNPGNGAYIKYPIGNNINMFVPSADGYWDLDLSEKKNNNVRFTKVVPVPSSGNGFFDWNEDTEEVILNSNGTGAYNLFDTEIVLNEFVSKIPLLGNDSISLTIPAVKPIRILAHWVYKVTLHNSSSKYLKLAALFYRARQNYLR